MMQFLTNTLIQNENIIETMESINDNQFKLVYLDVPWFTNKDALVFPADEKKLKLIVKEEIKKLAFMGSSPITLKELTKLEKSLLEKKRIELAEEKFDSYGKFISKILENAHRILDSKGILVFKVPVDFHIDYKLMLDQVFSNSYITQITLEQGSHIRNFKPTNHELLYFYSKSPNYKLNTIYEENKNYMVHFKYKDKKGLYQLQPLLTHRNLEIQGLQFTWKGIVPNKNQYWRYREEILNEKFKNDEIILKEEKAYLKYYLNEENKMRKKSSIWKADRSSFFGIPEASSIHSLKSQNIVDLINMTTDEGDWIFAPYDSDQKLGVIADHLKRNWVTIQHTYKEKTIYKEFLVSEYNEVSSLEKNTEVVKYNELLKGIEDINDLKDRISKLNKTVNEIQIALNLEEVSADKILEKMQEKIDEALKTSDIEYWIPHVKKWIDPHWSKLEIESQRFLPSAELLYHMCKETKNFDLSLVSLQYCKSLEKELFMTLFRRYVKYLISNNINISEKFSRDFKIRETSVFASFLKECTTYKKAKESEWHFELGKMTYVLKCIFDEKRLKDKSLLKENRLLGDFKKFLEHNFEYSIFDINFLYRLEDIVRLRNDSAHPNIITPERIKLEKELTKEKILKVLRYYKD